MIFPHVEGSVRKYCSFSYNRARARIIGVDSSVGLGRLKTSIVHVRTHLKIEGRASVRAATVLDVRSPPYVLDREAEPGLTALQRRQLLLMGPAHEISQFIRDAAVDLERA
jgi:hypothetical protein